MRNNMGDGATEISFTVLTCEQCGTKARVSDDSKRWACGGCQRIQDVITPVGIGAVEPARFGLEANPPLYSTDKRNVPLYVERDGKTVLDEWVTTHERTNPYTKFALYDGARLVMTGYTTEIHRAAVMVISDRIYSAYRFDERVTVRVSNVGYGQWAEVR